MAFPLARTLTSGEQAPPAEVSVLSDAAQNPVAANSSAMPGQSVEATAAVTPTGPAEPEAPVPLASGTAQTEPEAMQPAPPGHLTDAVPLDGEGASTLTPGAPAQDAAAFSPKDVPASTNASPAAPSISVPDTIQPQALADAARNGDQLALFEIGARYTEGRNGLAADQAQAANWYQLAADKGFAPAQYRLGSMYEKGTGVARDIGKAKTFYEQAANQGNASAMHNLAVLYASGALGEQDYTTAANWFTKAADLGITDSQFNLAILCARGNGVAQDLGESYKWFAIAAKGGDKDAGAKRDEVAKAMKPADLEKARAATSAWKPQPLDNKANGIEIPDGWASNGTKTLERRHEEGDPQHSGDPQQQRLRRRPAGRRDGREDDRRDQELPEVGRPGAERQDQRRHGKGAPGAQRQEHDQGLRQGQRKRPKLIGSEPSFYVRQLTGRRLQAA